MQQFFLAIDFVMLERELRGLGMVEFLMMGEKHFENCMEDAG